MDHIYNALESSPTKAQCPSGKRVAAGTLFGLQATEVPHQWGGAKSHLTDSVGDIEKLQFSPRVTPEVIVPRLQLVGEPR